MTDKKTCLETWRCDVNLKTRSVGKPVGPSFDVPAIVWTGLKGVPPWFCFGILVTRAEVLRGLDPFSTGILGRSSGQCGLPSEGTELGLKDLLSSSETVDLRPGLTWSPWLPILRDYFLF